MQLGTSEVTCKLYSINIRLVCTLCATGKCSAGDEMLCGIMNLPKPSAKLWKYSNDSGTSVEDTAQENMEDAVEEAM